MPTSPTIPTITPIVQAIVKRAPSGMTAAAIASILGKEYATLMSELSGQPGHKLGADLLLPLMELAGSVEPMHELARHLGGVYLPLQKAESGESELVRALAESIKEFGDFASETAKDISDGCIPRDQFDRISREGHEAIRAIMTMIDAAQRVYEAQHGKA